MEKQIIIQYWIDLAGKSTAISTERAESLWFPGGIFLHHILRRSAYCTELNRTALNAVCILSFAVISRLICFGNPLHSSKYNGVLC